MMKKILFGLCFLFPLFAIDNSIKIYDASGSAQSNRPFTVLMLFVEGEFPNGTYPRPRIDGNSSSAWQVDVKNRWPDGSILSAFVSFPVSLSANGSVTVDFVEDSNPCHLGNTATCEAAALDQSGMLGFTGGNWNAQIRGTANSISYTVDAKTMISAGAWRYWLRGPIVTRIIVEEYGFTYDFGWQWDGSNWQAPSTATYKSVHPMFELSFYPGWNGVETGFRIENSWWTKLQNLKFKLEFLAGNPATTVYSKTNYDLEAKAASSYYTWSGTEPGAIFVDRNFPYLVATLLPSYDISFSVSSSVITSYLSQWASSVGTDDSGNPDPRSCTTQNPCAYIKTDMPGTGDHPNFGIIPRWQIAYLYAMRDSQFTVATKKDAYDKLIIGSADAAVTIPIHYRESNSSMSPSYRNYLDWPSDQSTPSFGRIKSISAHPDGRTGQYDTSGPYPAQYICSNCPARTHSWIPDMYHWPSLYSVPYILSGRFTYLMSLQQSAAHWIGWDNPYYGRHLDWGIQYDSTNVRGPARALKEIFWAYLLSPDSPERNYFANKLKYNDAAYEGVFNITNGTYSDKVVSNCSTTNTIESFTTTIDSTTTQKPNGTRKIFYISSNGNTGIKTITSLTVNGVSKTVGIYNQDTGKDWYFIPGARIVIQDNSAPALTSTDTLYIAGSLSTAATPWCHGYAQLKWTDNPLPMIGMGSSSSTGYGGITATSPWMLSYLVMHIGWIRQTGALKINGNRLFEYSGAKLAKSYIEGTLHPQMPIFYFGDYRMPLQTANGLITTWQQFITEKNPSVSLTQDISSASTSFTINCVAASAGCINVPGTSGAIFKIDNEYIYTCNKSTGTSTTTFTVCSGGRGYWGTTSTSHTAASAVVNAEWRTMGDGLTGHTYPNLWLNALATFYDVETSLGSGLKAYEKAVGLGYDMNLRTTDQRYAIIPRKQPESVKIFGNSVNYIAPTLAPCYWSLNEGIKTSDGGGNRNRTIIVTGTGKLRIECEGGIVYITK